MLSDFSAAQSLGRRILANKFGPKNQTRFWEKPFFSLNSVQKKQTSMRSPHFLVWFIEPTYWIVIWVLEQFLSPILWSTVELRPFQDLFYFQQIYFSMAKINMKQFRIKINYLLISLKRIIFKFSCQHNKLFLNFLRVNKFSPSYKMLI